MPSTFSGQPPNEPCGINNYWHSRDNPSNLSIDMVNSCHELWNWHNIPFGVLNYTVNSRVQVIELYKF